MNYENIPVANPETIKVGDVYFDNILGIVTEISEDIIGIDRKNYLRYNQEQKRNNPVAKGIFLRERDSKLEIVAVTTEFLKRLKSL